jgi:hypothetical protein
LTDVSDAYTFLTDHNGVGLQHSNPIVGRVTMA